MVAPLYGPPKGVIDEATPFVPPGCAMCSAGVPSKVQAVERYHITEIPAPQGEAGGVRCYAYKRCTATDQRWPD
jgi:hypothetical protein